MKKVIKNANVVLIDEILTNASVLIEDGVIKTISSENIDCLDVLDANGLFLVPGFVDLHCHGCMNLDFIDCDKEQMKQIADFHLRHGTTTMLATTMTVTDDLIEDCLKTFSEYLNENRSSNVVGVHMEGPYFSPDECGAQDPSVMKKPTKEELNRLKNNYPFIKRISVAPELEGAMEFGKEGEKLGIVMSIGHTSADFDTVVCASENGYNLMTHFYSGMKGVTRVNCYRVAGAVEAAYYLDDMNVEIIADGRHLPPSLLKLIYKIKGADKISLVTDATRGCGLENGQTSFIGPLIAKMPIVIENDVAFTADRKSFAGSTATFDRLYKTMGQAIGKDFVNLSKMASTNPAKILGLFDRGEIKQGNRADLILMDEDFAIKKVIFGGEEVEI